MKSTRHSFNRGKETKYSDLFSPSVIILVLANLVPVYGVLFLGWKVFSILVLFWIENIIVGVLNVLKMMAAVPEQKIGWAGKVFLIPFFIFHYGMFTAIHGVFVVSLFGGDSHGTSGISDVEAVLNLIFDHQLIYAVLGLALSHGFSFLWNYMGNGEYREATLQELMSKPYGRVIVLHLVIIFGGFLVMALDSPMAGLILLVVLKIGLDVHAHLREHKSGNVSP